MAPTERAERLGLLTVSARLSQALTVANHATRLLFERVAVRELLSAQMRVSAFFELYLQVGGRDLTLR